MTKHLLLPIVLTVAIFSCKKENMQPAIPNTATALGKTREMTNNPDDAMLTTAGTSPGGYIYTESNASDLNKVIIYKQHADGTLTWWKEVASGGKGTGAGLGSQGAVCMSEDHQWLFAVNAGSNSFSVFYIHADGDITLKGSVSSLGEKPNSITTHGNMAYVLNNGNSTICGFMINNGVLTKMAGSPYNLSGAAVDAPQISFSPDGSSVIVTEKATNTIDNFKLNAWGDVASVVYNKSTGAVPFGFAYARKYLVVSDAGDGACTSYKERGSGILRPINGAVPDGQAAACWVATAKYGYYAYTADAASNTVSTYYVDSMGALTYISSAAAELKPLDLVVSADNMYVYNINATSQKIVTFKRMKGGELKMIGDVATAPYGVGLAAL